jgi:hypothetical protein
MERKGSIVTMETEALHTYSTRFVYYKTRSVTLLHPTLTAVAFNKPTADTLNVLLLHDSRSLHAYSTYLNSHIQVLL